MRALISKYIRDLLTACKHFFRLYLKTSLRLMEFLTRPLDWRQALPEQQAGAADPVVTSSAENLVRVKFMPVAAETGSIRASDGRRWREGERHDLLLSWLTGPIGFIHNSNSLSSRCRVLYSLRTVSAYIYMAKYIIHIYLFKIICTYIHTYIYNYILCVVCNTFEPSLPVDTFP